MRCKLNINIYYGGRGLIDDPTIYVINKMQEILEELRVRVERYNLYEHKHTIPTLPQTMKNADGIILATTIEWYGIGGYMQQFLDACWLYGDKEKIAKIYMCPIVMSTTYGEREGKLNLATAWEILGGQPCSGICGYISDTVTLELNEQYTQLIEKKAENMYRSINQKVPSFPASNQAVKQMVSITRNVDLTPQETEQLSQYISDDSYVQRQKEDIQELASLFRNKLVKEDGSYEEAYLSDIRKAYQAGEDCKGTFAIMIGDREQPLILKISKGTLECYYGNNQDADVEMSLSKASFEDIISGRMTFQRAFMSGTMKMKGDFMILRMLDQCFAF
jgi:putative sterol carrier protein/multimeric flavodoxin WrbA